MAAIIIKSGTTSIAGATVVGSFSYFSGNTTQNLGPSEVTGFYQGIDAPDGGYAVYALGGTSGVTVRIANDDTELNTILIQDGAPNITLAENIAWASSTGLVFINSGTVSSITPTPTPTPTVTPTETPTPTPTVTPTTSSAGGYSFDLGINNLYGSYACYNESSGNTQTLYSSASTLTVGTPLYYTYSFGFYSSGVTNSYVSNGTNYYYLDGSGTIQSYGGGSCPIPPNTFTLGINNLYGSYACYNESSGNTQTIYSTGTTLTTGTQLYYTYDSGFDIYSSAVTNSYVSNGTNYYYTDNQGIIQSYGGGSCPIPPNTFTLGINNLSGDYACYNESSGNTQTIYSTGTTLTTGTQLYYTYDSGFDIYSSAVTNSYVSNGTNYYYTDNQGIIQSYNTGDCPIPPSGRTGYFISAVYDDAVTGGTQATGVVFGTGTPGESMCNPSTITLYANEISGLTAGTYYIYDADANKIRTFSAYGGSSYGSMSGVCTTPSGGGRSGYYYATTRPEAISGGTQINSVTFGGGDMCTGYNATDSSFSSISGYLYIYNADDGNLRQYYGSNSSTVSAMSACVNANSPIYYYSTSPNDCYNTSLLTNVSFYGGSDICSATGFSANELPSLSPSTYYMRSLFTDQFREFYCAYNGSVSFTSSCTYYSCL